jgi:L-lactate dehydrogenase complex protein LldF
MGIPYEEDPERLTRIARDYLRERYREVDLGVSGANFLVAETGAVVVNTNEGNADLAMLAPRVHVVVAGIEKLVARAEHLGAFLKLLARSATAQDMTVYTSFIHGPRRAYEPDGPEAVHVILLDNGRSGILDEESRELLRCIRCGACLNACPVYRNVGGGHAYGSVYSGPIGAILTPHLKGRANYPDLPKASTLCGACHHACPVNIDIPRHLVRLRREASERRISSRWGSLALRAWAWMLRSPARYRLGQVMTRTMLRRIASARPAGDGLSDGGWVERLRAPGRAWTDERDLPTPPSRTFRDWWRDRAKDDGA